MSSLFYEKVCGIKKNPLCLVSRESDEIGVLRFNFYFFVMMRKTT